jgi:hypothetical protein
MHHAYRAIAPCAIAHCAMWRIARRQVQQCGAKSHEARSAMSKLTEKREQFFFNYIFLVYFLIFV